MILLFLHLQNNIKNKNMFKSSIFSKIFISILVVAFISGIIVLLATLTERAYSESKSLISENKLLAQTLARVIKSGYLANRMPFQALKQVTESENIVFLWIVDSDGEIYFANDFEIFGQKIQNFQPLDQIKVQDSLFYKDNQKIKLIIAPIDIDITNQLWNLYLGVSLQRVEAVKQKIIFNGALMFLGVIILAALIAFYFSKSFTKPLKVLMRGVREIGKGNLNYKINIKTKDEFNHLAQAFNETTIKLKHTRERDKLINQAKSEFIAIAAHQLRTPLTSVKWVLKMVLGGSAGQINKEQKSFLKKGYKTNERIIRMVNDLLSIARIEEGRFGYKFKMLDLIKFVKDIVQDNKEKFKKKGLKLEFLKPKQEFSKCKIDPKSLRLALQNIIDNAYDYTSKGFVKISIKQEQKEFLLKIQDTGVGVPISEQSRLFTKFFRGSNIMKKGLGTEGTGLGLYIVQNIIKKHGGRVWLESELNKGTEFYFTLPL
ncbi:hypothetical protein CL633_00285 [bacterium]|nr:hypothetical protein [bacterium]